MKHPPQKILNTLQSVYVNPRTELIFDSPFQLVVAVALSAQCTDKQVNRVTPELFQSYPTAKDLAHAELKSVEKIIHSCGFYKTKAKNIILMAQQLEEKFKGTVPTTLEELVTLAGVGRKTASVVLNQAFDIPAIAVDTHVARVSYRLGWTNSKNPITIEKDLKELFASSSWASINGLLILHGRRQCKARKPECDTCCIQNECLKRCS